MPTNPPATLIDAANLKLVHEPIESSARLDHSGTTTGLQEITTFGDVEVGVWEMSQGSMRDVEASEIFVVLSGSGTLKILESHGFAAQEFKLHPGALVQLQSGMHTEWRITQTLRKIYLSP